MKNLAIRPPTAEDLPAIRELVSLIGSNDYVAEAVESWIGRSDGQVLVAFAGSELVGIARAQGQAEGVVWFHAMRVHPSYRRRGVARTLQEALEAWGRERSYRLGRLATAQDNLPAQQALVKLGFERGPAFRCWEARASYPRSPGARVAVEADRPWLKSSLVTSPLRRQAGGLYAAGWSWRPLDWPVVEQGLAGGQALVHDEGWALLAIDEEGDVWLAWLEGSPAATESLARRARAEAAGRRAKTVYGLLPDAPELRAPLEKARWQSLWPLYLYHKPLTPLPGS